MKAKATKLAIILVSAFFSFLNVEAKNNPAENQQLDARQKSLVSISSYTTQGNIDALNKALNEGLDAGVTINEIKELLVQLYAYCGFPRSLNGIGTFMKVLEERKSNGINDEQGKEIRMHSTSGDRYEKGRKVLEELTQTPQAKPAPGFGEFSPRIDAFLKEHLFADIFDSDVLSYHQRELITIASLASLPGAEPQLSAHINFGMNVGVTEKQLYGLFAVIEKTAGKEAAESGRKILKRVIEDRKK